MSIMGSKIEWLVWRENMKSTLKCIFIFFVFISGYICGKIGIDTMLNALMLSLSNLDLIQIIGFSSSIITLILFIAYIFGKYLIIKQMTKTIFESVDASYNNESNNLKIVEEYNIGENNSEQIYLYSSDTLNWIKIYEYDYYDKKDRFSKGKLLMTHDHLRNGFAIKINTYLPCGIPRYIVQYQRYDFIIGEFHLNENGKNGIIDEGISINHTAKSILYYLVKS